MLATVLFNKYAEVNRGSFLATLNVRYNDEPN